MILVDNKTNIDTSKINKVITMLPAEYTNLNVEIKIYGTLISLLKLITNRKIESIGLLDVFKIYWLQISSTFYPKANVIEIYLFAIRKNKIQNLVFNLFHELHHKYQTVYMKDFFEDECSKYLIPKSLKDMDLYFENTLELDANNFALKFYNDNKETIDKIFGLDDDYEIVGTGQKS